MKTEFVLRRIHSLTGILPLYVFIVYHIADTTTPFFTFHFTERNWPLIIVLGIVPIVVHGLIGLYIIIQNKRSGTDRSSGMTRQPGVLYKLQIISAIVIALFICTHAILFEALRYSQGYTIYVLSAAVYFISMPAFAFHIGYGTYTFCLTWGFCGNPATRKALRRFSAILGGVFGIAVVTLFIFVFISIKGMLNL